MKTNLGLVEYAKAQIGKPYWFGTFGQLTTEKLWSDKAAQYPKYYSATRKKKAIPSQLGKKAHDCVGLIKGYLWSDSPEGSPKYNSAEDWSADMTYNKATTKGAISTIPEKPGICVWRKGHIGVYIGGGKVVEAKGFDYGVVESKLAGSTFTHWLEHPLISYATVSSDPKKEPTPAPQPTVDINHIADDILRGKFGNGEARKKALTEQFGKDIAEQAQKRVNEILGANKTASKSNKYSVVVSGSSVLNIRSGPGTNYGVIGALSKGTVVEVLSISGGWARISRGYISATYIKKV